MPSIRSLTMTLDAVNENGTFSEGDRLTGKVTLDLIKEITVQSLYIKAKGDAVVRWTQKRGDHSHTHTAQRRYFKLKQFLVPVESKDTIIPRGTHVYKFSFNIPPGSMPSSFKGTHGKIVYKLEAALSRSWRMDREVEKEIHFVSKSFPNLQSLMSSQVASAKKEMGLFSKGHVQMDVTVDRRAYAPGQTVAIVAKINNSSSSDVTPKFSLIQDVLFHASSDMKQERTVIHKVVDSCIRAYTEKSVRCVIRIPHGQIQTIENCEIISVEYYLKVYLDISFAFNPEVTFPVVILPPDLALGTQPGVAAGPYPAGATGGPSNSNFPPLAASRHSSPASPHSGSHRYLGAQRYSAPGPAYPASPQMYAAPPNVYWGQPAHMRGGYNNPVPQHASPYGSPFSSSSSTSVLHPPPTAPTFHPSPSAPEIQPSPSAPFNISPTAPSYDSLPSTPMMNIDFLSQSDEPPPAYSLLFPSSATDTPDANK
ncbi:arrestin domain-containing protein 3-like [Seriola lalandi dorsalis]|uniref:Arrestin domain-containing protein 3-like n=1 Tax=Seriola lalandi dorsalis TaxID=1841481 RepID=A0A3B4XXW1_SERLL|nr:arrestin domain-containing protein 3-like [Seriola lalandi dorsalis]